MMNRTWVRKWVMTGLAVSIFLSTGVNGVMADTAIGRFQVRQERSSTSGVLVSKPASLDEKIVNILYANNIQSLEDYARWLEGRVRFQEDTPGYDDWSEPLDTLRRGSGDCEDFSFLTAEVMRILGYKPRFIAFRRKGEAHAVCAIQLKDGHYVWFDNGKLKNTRATSIDEFSRHIVSEYHYTQLDELDLDTHAWNTLYQAAS